MASRKADGEPSSPAAVPKPKDKRYTIIRLAEIGGLKAKEKPTFTNEQMQRGATFNVHDFDPDTAGEGALTDFERNIYNKLKPIAREGGKIGIHELYTVIDQTAKAEKEASFFSRLFIASLVLVARTSAASGWWLHQRLWFELRSGMRGCRGRIASREA